MDILTLCGALLGVVAIVAGFTLEGGRFLTLFQLEAIVIVLGGTIGAVMVQNTWTRFSRGVRQLGMVFTKAKPVDRENLTVLLEWGHKAKVEGMLAFETIDPEGISPFAKRGLELIANGVPTAVIEDALQRELDAYERNQMAAARIWLQAGGYAPTFGILGAVLGLIQVTGHLLEPAQLGQGVAVAFITTLYGLALANILLLPIYGKIKARIDSELRFKKLYFDGLLAISRKESPHLIEARLLADIT
jgi:chemotaxis protein MotA